LGFGGHSRELLSRISPGGKLFAIDVDADELKKTETRLRAEGFDETILSVRQLNFAGVCKLMPDVPNGFDFIMADLGISSMQLDNPQRGFSLKVDGPLDLRLNQQRGTTAAELLQSLTAPEIEKLLRLNSDEPFSAKIAKKIYTARSLITTTAALTEIVRAAITEANQKIDDRNITKSIKRTFQALRIAVNGEFFVLEQFLNSLPLILKSGGRIAILSFHSGEDKRVKAAFSAGFEAGVYTDFCRFSIHASAQERYDNPRSKAAVLRWAVRS
jgi:16S rRNA (cytosine1402-N4)-methyltransferase